MRLTWKDAAATAVTAAAVALYVAFLAGADLPLVSGPRALGAAVLGLGMVGCTLGGAGSDANRASGWSKLAAALGIVALAAALIVIVAGSHAALAVLVASTVALWL